MQINLPSADVIDEIHSIIINDIGGLKGTIHPKSLESVLARPMNHMEYSDSCDIHLVCALILHSIATHHIFSDGNKRTALVVTIMTYRLNDVALSYSLTMNNKFEKLVLKVASKKTDVKSIRKSLMRLVKEFQS